MPTYKVEIVDDAGQTFHVYASADTEAEAELLAIERAEHNWTLLHVHEVASACVIGESELWKNTSVFDKRGQTSLLDLPSAEKVE